MLDFLACQSPEKLVIDAEAIANSRRLLRGVDQTSEIFSQDYYSDFEFPGNFLKNKLTRDLYRKEFYLPGEIFDRGSLREWKDKGRLDTFSRAKIQVNKLLADYQNPEFDAKKLQELTRLVTSYAQQAGLEKLPLIDLD